MSKSKKTSKTVVKATNGVIKFSYYVLLGLLASTIVCIIYGWFGKPLNHYGVTGDNVVTGSLQNYYFIIGALALIPGIVFMSNGLKEEFDKRYWSDEKRFGVCSAFVLAVIIITALICGWAHSISATTSYGINGYQGVVFFLMSAIPFIMTSLFYGVFKTLSMLKEKGEFFKSIYKYLPIIFLVVFMILTFISCMLAPGAADDVIGSEKAAELGATPSEVLSKTFNGCTNLKDGYWAFMMYGSIFVVSILLGKDNKDKKLILIKIFVVVFTVISLLTLNRTFRAERLLKSAEKSYEEYLAESSVEQKLSKEDFINHARNEEMKFEIRTNIFAEQGIYRNTNHFAYILSMSVIAAMILAIIEKKVYFKIAYLLAYWIMLKMLIINNTFGGYLGVLVAMIGFAVYGITILCSKLFGNGKRLGLKINWQAVIIFLLIVVIFCTGTVFVTNEKGESISLNNIKSFVKDFGIISKYVTSTESGDDNTVSEIKTEVVNAGSGRAHTWLRVPELVKQRPLFGYGLECLLFQFSGQFDVGEGRTHNLVLQLLATTGIPATLFYLTALAIIFFRLLSNWKNWDEVQKICVFVGLSYMITALTGNSSYYTSPFFMMFLGFVALTSWKKKIDEVKK